MKDRKSCIGNSVITDLTHWDYFSNDNSRRMIARE